MTEPISSQSVWILPGIFDSSGYFSITYKSSLVYWTKNLNGGVIFLTSLALGCPLDQVVVTLQQIPYMVNLIFSISYASVPSRKFGRIEDYLMRPRLAVKLG